MKMVRSESEKSDQVLDSHSAAPTYVKPELRDFGKMQDIVHTGSDSLMDDSGMYEGIVGTMS